MSDLKVWYELEIGGKKLAPTPYSITFHRDMGNHTLVDVSSVYPRALPMRERPPIFAPGAPVKIAWGTRPTAMRNWYGYVHYTHPDFSEEEGSETRRMLLVGTGHALEKQYTKRWLKVTDSGIAQQIAEKYNLALVAHKTNRVHEYLMQPGISDLEWLKMRGRECGRTVHIENGVIYFVDPASLAMARRQQPFKEKMDKQREAERVVNVTSRTGTLVPNAGRQAKRALTGFDIKTNKLLYAKQVPSEPAPDFVARDTAITDAADLYQNVDALQIKHEQWLHATMDLVVDSNVDHMPGQLIDLSGRSVDDSMHGLWMITQSSHTLESRLVSDLGMRRFDSHLQISRNTTTTFAIRDRRVPAISDECVRAGGKWVSASQQVVLL